LDRVEEGEALATAAAADLAAAAGMGLGPDGKRERALFVFHPRGTNLTAAGAGVVGHQLLEHVGLENILSKEQGWITLQAEAAVAAGPTVVVTTSSALAGIGGMDSLVNHPALAATPAGKNGRVIVLDTMSALGYGPRTGRAALRLAKALRPNADLPEPAIDAFIRGVGLSP
jgi:iron complex transport system substrate-binding protein